MKKFLKTYKSVIILLAAIIIGAIVGIAFKEKAAVLKPFGDIFLNLLFVVIVPLIFLSITTSIAKIKQPKRLGKIMITIFCVFIVMSLVSVLVGVLSTYSFKLVNTDDGAKIRAELEEQSGTAETTETEPGRAGLAERLPPRGLHQVGSPPDRGRARLAGQEVRRHRGLNPQAALSRVQLPCQGRSIAEKRRVTAGSLAFCVTVCGRASTPLPRRWPF